MNYHRYPALCGPSEDGSTLCYGFYRSPHVGSMPVVLPAILGNSSYKEPPPTASPAWVPIQVDPKSTLRPEYGI